MGKWSKYSQKYKKQWEENPLLMDWIGQDPKNESKAYCKYCRCSLSAHLKDLKDHGITRKHTKNLTIQASISAETQEEEEGLTGPIVSFKGEPISYSIICPSSSSSMSKPRHQPEVHSVTTTDEIQKISNDLSLGLSPSMVEAVTAKTTESLKVLQSLDAMADFVPEVNYPRTPGYKPEPKDNVGNSWAWRCDVRGAQRGKLAGKKVAIKDNCAVAGVPMTNGSLVLEGYTPEYDATVVTRILDAGGNITGKAACDDFCLSAMGFTSNDGFIHFPDKPDLTVGGSSGGSGVLVATNEVDMAIACDQGGSIRIPAAYTGTVGFKPTHGLVPYTGIVSIDPMVDHAGPITKNVHDCALLLETIAGYDGLDGRQMNIKIPEYTKLLEESDMTGRKLGILIEGFDVCSENTKQSVLKFLTNVGSTGLETTHVSVPWHTEGLNMLIGFLAQGCANGMLEQGTACQFLKGFSSTSLEKAVRQGLQSSANVLAPGAVYFLVMGDLLRRRYGNHYYTKSRNLGIKLSHAYDEALKHCEVLVMPTLTHSAKTFVTENEIAAEGHSAYFDQSIGMIANTAPFNVSGHPALTLPLGPLGDGTVDALMIVGRKYDELTVLQVARALEKIIPAREGLH